MSDKIRMLWLTYRAWIELERAFFSCHGIGYLWLFNLKLKQNNTISCSWARGMKTELPTTTGKSEAWLRLLSFVDVRTSHYMEITKARMTTIATSELCWTSASMLHGDKVLEEHLAAALKNATYVPSTVQNKIIDVIADHMRDQTLAPVKESPFYTILVDAVTDASNKEQLALALRCVTYPAVPRINQSIIDMWNLKLYAAYFPLL